MSWFVLRVKGVEVAEMHTTVREAVRWSRWMLDEDEVGILTGDGFERELRGQGGKLRWR